MLKSPDEEGFLTNTDLALLWICNEEHGLPWSCLSPLFISLRSCKFQMPSTNRKIFGEIF